MRWLFVFLLLINAVYVTWELTRTEEEVKQVGDSKTPALILISELESVTKSIAIKASEHTSDVTKSEKDNISVANAPVAEKVIVKTESLSSVNKWGGKKDATVALVMQKPSVKKKLNNPVSPVNSCYTLGPFREKEKIRAFFRKIKDYVVDVSFRTLEEQEISLFWVFLPPEKNAQAAYQLSKQLIAKKIRDYYIISSGDKINGISLGHFEEKERAVKHAKSLKNKGLNPVIEAVYRSYELHWLDYKNKQGQQIPDDIFTKNMYARINKLGRTCL